MIETIILPEERWPLVEPVVRGECHNGMPVTAAASTFLTALDGERLAGFIHLEQLFHYNILWVAPDYRRTRLAYRLMREVDSLIPAGFSTVSFVDKLSVSRMLRRLGGRSLGQCEVLRKDY